ncbi:C-Jun-amino-terminal kinase-interacting protein 2 [Oryzias melastigma]|uniref:C-Jun-amino-terminal kinase-interacting protein 2 n=1 Tax=Oryzias melastigma TaxID=30732 RepID=A0A834FJ25_ORYME|nr:C-Jun-amino-terminal kinase-interacting protein 2 [Oryzias melastigma]
MADRAEMFSLSTFHSLSPPGCRPAHDISLEEFDDEDLSEITDDCGIGLNYDSDPYEKDSLILEKSDLHHPVCSFQDDFQEFEMIDDEEEDEEEDDEEVDPDAPPSPSVSPPPSPILGTLKSRPTTLNLTTAVSQDSLNNNSSLSPKKGSWQDSLCNPTSQGRLSPTHSCLEDGSHVTGQCPASPITQAPRSQSKGIPPTQAREGGNPQSPHRPLLCDMEGNRRERLEYGSFGQHKSHHCSTDPTEPKADCLNQTGRVPSVDEHSQCSDTEVDHDLNSYHNHKHSNRRTTDTYTIVSESGIEPENDLDPDGTSRCLSSTAPMGANDGADTPLSDEELDKDFEVEFVCMEKQSSYVEFPSIEPPEPVSFSDYHSEAQSESNSADAPVVSTIAQGPNDSTSPSSDPGIADMNQRGYITSDQDKDLSSPGSDSDLEGELEAAFSCGGPVVSNMISSISETELDLTSDESSSGRSSHLTNSIEEASSPTSDQELDPDTELEQDSGIVGLKATLLLGQPDPIKEGSCLPSPSPLPSPTIATPSPIDSPVLPPESYDDGQALMGLQSVDDEVPFEHQADPDETLPPTSCCEDGQSKPMVLEIEPDHSLESFKRSFYLPVGPRLMPSSDEYDTSEGDSESESEDELSENSDSPWLLSNLVNRMISEGSYPISCPEQCFKRKASVSDTISPSSDIGDRDSFNDEEQEQDRGGGEETLESSERSNNVAALKQRGGMSLYISNPTGDTITPLNLESSSNYSSSYLTKNFDKNSFGKMSKNVVRKEDDEEPNNDLMVLERRGDLDSPSLSESVVSDKDEGRETEPRPTSRSSASLERITEVKNSLTLDIPTAQTNRCFTLTYSTDNDDEEDNGDSYPFLEGMRKKSFDGSDLELDSSPPIDSSVQDHLSPDQDLPLCEKEQALRPPTEADGLAYDSMKYTLVVDENTTLELVSLRRCTSILSDDSELSTLCDEEPLRPVEVGYDQGDEEIDRPELLSSSEDSSPEADLPFSKKFLNVFVNSTSRSSSTESFGLFSCTINGEERDQTHRAVYRFIPRHADELELDVDDPLYVEEEEDDYWYRGYNMRTGERGIFPAFYAHEVIGQSKELLGVKRNPAWIETFNVQFLGSVEVPYHQGNGILCAAMQKIAMSRKQTVHVRPPSLCELEISLQGVKLIMSLEDEYDTLEGFDRCSHFFQMKNISFCGCHPRNNCYFGFITKHPMLNRFACHVFVSQETMRPVAESVGRAFQEYYQEHLEYACPTEDIYLE